MNTPAPCDNCVHLYYDVMQEDDPDYEATCKLNQEKHPCCKHYLGYDQLHPLIGE